MGFDLDKFRTFDIQQRTEAVAVPELAGFFGDGEPAEFTVRGLTADEHGRMADEVKQNKAAALRGMAKALATGDRELILAALQEYMDDEGDRQPDEIVLRLYALRFGCVEPALDHPAALKLLAVKPAFYRLSDKILQLSNAGPVPPGESKPSGTTAGSKTRSSSRPSGGTKAGSSERGSSSSK